MAHATLPRRRPPPLDPADAGPVVRRARPLPGGRAVAGGFLVALAAVGAFAGATTARTNTRIGYLVAARDLASGVRISSADLAIAPIDAPAAVRQRAFRHPASLEGAVLVAPLASGELIQASAVVRDPTGTPLSRQISVPIEAARAVGGHLQRGEYVDLLATYGTGADAYTVSLVRNVRVADIGGARDGVSDARTQVLTLAVDQPAQAMAIAHAVNAGALTVVRAGATTAISGDPPAYRAPGAPGPTTGAAKSAGP